MLYTGTITLVSTDPTQLGRLSRDGITPDWSFQKAFPGTLNPTTSYHYETISLFVPNWFPYLQITIDSNNTNILGSTYDTSYNPNPIAPNLGLDVNYLGDPGGSGNFFGNPLFFQVVDQTAANSPSGGTVVVVLNETTTNGRTQFTSRRVGGGLLRHRFRRGDTGTRDFHAPGRGATGPGSALSPPCAGPLGSRFHLNHETLAPGRALLDNHLEEIQV